MYKVEVLADKTEMVEFLLTQKANVNAVNNKNLTALHYAALSGNLAICKMLVEHSANLEAEMDKGVTPLLFAIGNKHLDVIKYLLDSGAHCHETVLRFAKASQDENIQAMVEAVAKAST